MADQRRKGIFASLFGKLGGASHAQETTAHSDVEGQSLQVFQQRCIIVPTPAGWKYQQEGGGFPVIPTFSVTHSSNEVKVLVSVFPDAVRNMATLGAIEQFVRATWELHPDRQTAVDKVLRIQTADNSHGKSVWHQYTDGALVGRPIPPNQWLHVTKGIRSWDSLLLSFTVLSNSLESVEYLQGRDIALSGIWEPSQATRG